MKLYEYVKNTIIPLNISHSKKEIILNLIKSYNLKEATIVLDSCIEINAETPTNETDIILSLIVEIDQHIEMFNDDFDDDVVYNDF